jgi:hypothetical protein
MTILVEGPGWSSSALPLAQGRYPLRVEGHVGAMVDRLLPGVITLTPHQRSFALHALVWCEADRRQLPLDAGLELMRRAEVVVAAASLMHASHRPGWERIAIAHGADRVKPLLEQDRASFADLTALPLTKRSYAQSAWGFAGAYNGSETTLDLIQPGRPPAPGARANPGLLNDALGDALRLAEQDSITRADAAAVPHLCVCQGAVAGDGPWLAACLQSPPESAREDVAVADEARRDTCRLLARILSRGPDRNVVHGFSSHVAWGPFLEEDEVASSLDIAQAWRGIVLRNHSVGAWRRLWSWLVDQLQEEPITIDALGARLAESLPDISVAELIDTLPESADDGVLLPAEHALRQASAPNPFAELQMLALGAKRLDQLEGIAAGAFQPPRRRNDLDPLWVRDTLFADHNQRLQRVAADLTPYLCDRARRVALQKMQIREGRLWTPSRLKDYDGRLLATGQEGFGDVSLRVDILASVLTGCGTLESTDDGFGLTTDGEALLG